MKKTIEQAAKKYAEENRLCHGECVTDSVEKIKKAVMYGAELATKWHSVDECMPDVSHVKDRKQFLVKGYFQVGDKKGNDHYITTRLNQFQYEWNKMIIFEEPGDFISTHWREINFE